MLVAIAIVVLVLSWSSKSLARLLLLAWVLGSFFALMGLVGVGVAISILDDVTGLGIQLDPRGTWLDIELWLSPVLGLAFPLKLLAQFSPMPQRKQQTNKETHKHERPRRRRNHHQRQSTLQTNVETSEIGPDGQEFPGLPGADSPGAGPALAVRAGRMPRKKLKK